MTNSTIHPKWISCFPDGQHRWDDGTPDPEEDDEDVELYEVIAEDLGLDDSLDARLRAMGY